ncbi:hypothetical protein PXK00_16875, partial [Phaeobacter sp. QD34_3]|uniref:hypothetical protein n=1 Tax=unclassified Phaeobacter TaxID=2621772 RepID=UPI00237F025A
IRGTGRLINEQLANLQIRRVNVTTPAHPKVIHKRRQRGSGITSSGDWSHFIGVSESLQIKNPPRSPMKKGICAKEQSPLTII